VTAVTDAQRWAGRHVVVTGGTSGIGLAAAALLAEAGARVTAVAAADAGEPERLAAAIEAGRAAHGPAAALVTCAALAGPGYRTELAGADLRRHLEAAYLGTVHAIRLTLPDLLRAERASITCVASAAGFLGGTAAGARGPSKFAVRGLCEALRQELRPRGITVTAVCPAEADTPLAAARTLLAGTVAGRALVASVTDHAIAGAAVSAARP
jgi:3-dehydrosphinganine reductase